MSQHDSIWFEAVELKHYSIMQKLIDLGYLENENKDGLTAYQITDDPEVKQFLKFNGAVTGETKFKASKDFLKFALGKGVMWRSFDFTGIDLNEFKEEFKSAVINNYPVRVRLFVENGYKITDEFAYAKIPEMWQLLKELGANINVEIGYKETVLINQLRYARNISNVEFLIKLGCDVNIKDKLGKTIFDYGYETAESKKQKIMKKIEDLVKQL